MKQVLVIQSNRREESETFTFLGQSVEILWRGCDGDPGRALRWIEEFDGRVEAIALEGMPAVLELGHARRSHVVGDELRRAARQTPVVDGAGIRAGLERWGVILAERAQPGIFSQKRTLMVPGLNHVGMAEALGRRSSRIRYADPLVFFSLPDLPGVGSRQTLEQAAPPTLERLKDEPFPRLHPRPDGRGHAKAPKAFRWADIIAGDIGAIRRHAPDRLRGKTVVVESADEEDLRDLKERGAFLAATLMPSLDPKDGLGRWSAAVIEALLVALRPDPNAPLTEDTYLNLMADIQWTPEIRALQPEETGINRFAFVIHPLDVGFIHKHPSLKWTRYLPDPLIESVAAYMPPFFVSRITGGKSPATGQRIEGMLISLGATPRRMMAHGERFTYRRLNAAARMAERKGARIMGLGAFTSVVGDAGITVAHEADIAITSGNSLTVAATLEAAKQAVIQMGATDLTRGKVMIIGATGSIGAVCSRLLAQAIFNVVLVSIEPERLIDLKRKIQEETPGAVVQIATSPGELIGDCDLVVSATSAFGQRVIDITKCKPGAVICDVARPPDVNQAEAALRPDVLVIESGEVLIPGEVDFGYNIGLPPRTSYACLAETALLAMEGRFEDYTLGRNITMDRVKEIYRLFKKHGFQIAGLRSFGKYLTAEDIAEKRKLAQRFVDDPGHFRDYRAEASKRLASMPVMAKGVKASRNNLASKVVWAAAAAGAALLLLRRARRPSK